MKLYEVTMSCDHDLLVLAYTPEGAEYIAKKESISPLTHTHDVTATVVMVQEVTLDEPRLIEVLDGLR